VVVVLGPGHVDCRGGRLCRALGASRRKKRAGEELTIFVLIEPSTFDVEELDAGEAGKRERVHGELRDRLVRACVRFVVEDVDCAIPDLDKIDVASDGRCCVIRKKPDAVLLFERGDVIAGEPDGDFDRDRG